MQTEFSVIGNYLEISVISAPNVYETLYPHCYCIINYIRLFIPASTWIPQDPKVSVTSCVPRKEPKKEGRCLISLNHVYWPYCGAGCIEVNGRYMGKHTKKA